MTEQRRWPDGSTEPLRIWFCPEPGCESAWFDVGAHFCRKHPHADYVAVQVQPVADQASGEAVPNSSQNTAAGPGQPEGGSPPSPPAVERCYWDGAA